MDSTTQESVRKKKKRLSEKFIPPQFATYTDSTDTSQIAPNNIIIESQFTSPVENKSILSDEESKTALSSSKKRRLRKKQALEKKLLFSAKLSINEIHTHCANTPIEDTDNSIITSSKVNLVNAIEENINEHHLVNSVDIDSISLNANALIHRLHENDNPNYLSPQDSVKETCEKIVHNKIATTTMVQGKVEGKSREEIKAEREAKKLAKQQQKQKKSLSNETHTNITTSEPLKLSLNQELVNINATANTDDIAKGISDVIISDNRINKNDKSKSELKSERRAIQEAQRAAKEQAISAKAVKGAVANSLSGAKGSDLVKKITPITVLEVSKNTINSKMRDHKPKIKMYQADHKVKLFQHLYAEREAAVCTPREPINSKDIHPAIMKLGVRYASGIVVGSNARCIAFLDSLKQVVRDFSVPAQAEFGRALEARLGPGMAYLHRCRPLAVSMQNALKHFRYQLRQLPNDILESEAKVLLNDAIDTYIREQIEVAGQAISIAVRNKISDGDVILTYACSSLVEQILYDTWSLGVRFRVVVVGARPRQEATVMLRRLTAAGLPCTLVDISALSYIMKGVSKVLLGAGALLANGSVLGRAGTAAVALAAAAHNVPTLVCCQTYKFSERVQADSFVYNEIGDPDELVKGGPLQGWRESGVQPLQLLYDVTPPDLVAAVITELAIVPCTSVPVVLRFKLSEYGI